MKKACLSSLASPPVPLNWPRLVWLAATVCLSPIVWGRPAIPEHGATAHMQRPVVAAPNAYLPALGPAPLRIYSPIVSARTAQLPPLAMFDSPPPPEPELANLMTNQPAFSEPPAPSTPPEPPPPSEASAVYGPQLPDNYSPAFGFDPTMGAASSAPIVTPQMLVQFFKPAGSNCLSGAWSMPVFVPPAPPATKPSTATYQSQ